MLDKERLKKESPSFVVVYLRFDFGCPKLLSGTGWPGREPRGAGASPPCPGCRSPGKGVEGAGGRRGAMPGLFFLLRK